jgi:two-component system, NtrC family, sensor kinase
VHPLLERQLRKTFPGKVPEDDALARLLRSVDEAYAAADEDRKQLERSLHLASDELFERNGRLESELEERKRLEVELQIAEKLRAVGQLAAGIAHEINTPIQFIGDSLHFLREAFADIERVLKAYAEASESATLGDDAQAIALRALIEEIDLAYLEEQVPLAIARCREGTERVTVIVRAMKTLAHPDTHEQELADVNAAITNTLIVVDNELKYVADVTLELESTRKVCCNIGEIQQVLLNLLVNAGHAVADRFADSSTRGTIRVATRDDGSDLVITIGDDGGGIPAELHRRIFEPFFTTKPVGKGSGQGLTIARTLIVDRHLGQLTFDSVPGKGTVFTIRLPANGKPQERVLAARLSKATVQGE